ncbi:hypothetical protein PsYK624_099880 [Phanerochaete sordida]|uniref:Uncharacterized protein n=1 Tax=Phanerochaete sordida TaxID=48140 RepID=A0A9P3GGE3_9APHY|nr:hypothetical protein PsYK624_099880 [Phanerochaete sordida]
MLSSPYLRIGLSLSCTAFMAITQTSLQESEVVEEMEEKERGQPPSLYRRTRTVYYLYTAASTVGYWTHCLGECTMALYELYPSSPLIKRAYRLFVSNPIPIPSPRSWWSPDPDPVRVRPLTGLFLLGCTLVLSGSALKLWSRRVPPRRTRSEDTQGILARGPYAILKAPLGWGTVLNAAGAILCYHAPGTWGAACIWGGQFSLASVSVMDFWSKWVPALPGLVRMAVREDDAAWARAEEEDD